MNNVSTATDKRTREKAVPFIATPYSNSSAGGIASDALAVRSAALIVPIRCSTPDRGALTEAHLNMNLRVHSSTSVYIGIGRFNADGITAYTGIGSDEIIQMHKKITGSSSPIASSGGTLLIDGVNIFPLIPKRGHANFNQDGFVIMLLFNRERVSANDILRSFEPMCSAQMGLI